MGELDLRYGPERQFFLRQPALVQRPDGSRYIDLYQKGVVGEPIFWNRLKEQGHKQIYGIELLKGQPIEGEVVLEDVEYKVSEEIVGTLGMLIYCSNALSGFRFVLDDGSPLDKRTRIEIPSHSEVTFVSNANSRSDVVRLIGGRKAIVTDGCTVDILGASKLEIGFPWLDGAQLKITKIAESDDI
jgi:hypothetical protein